MGKMRSLKPSFFTSESLALCSIRAMVTFEGLWTEGDDLGRGLANARNLKGAIWPQRDDVTHEDVEDDLVELANTGHIVLYHHPDGRRLYQVIRWIEHQSAAFRRTADSKLPPPPDDILQELACRGVQIASDGVLYGIGEDGIGEDREGDADASPSERRSRRSKAPEDFIVTEEMRSWAAEQSHLRGVDIDKQTALFLAHHEAKGSLFVNWRKAWQTWMLRVESFPSATARRPMGDRTSERIGAALEDLTTRGTRAPQLPRGRR